MMTLTFIICLFCGLLTAPPYQSVAIIAPEAIKPYEALWQATCRVESNCNPYAIGDLHLSHKSYGIAQIRQSRLDDYYRQTGIRYFVKDMFDTVKSKQIYMYYARGTDLEAISRRWNGGERGMNKKSTIKYWNLVRQNL